MVPKPSVLSLNITTYWIRGIVYVKNGLHICQDWLEGVLSIWHWSPTTSEKHHRTVYHFNNINFTSRPFWNSKYYHSVMVPFYQCFAWCCLYWSNSAFTHIYGTCVSVVEHLLYKLDNVFLKVSSRNASLISPKPIIHTLAPYSMILPPNMTGTDQGGILI